MGGALPTLALVLKRRRQDVGAAGGRGDRPRPPPVPGFANTGLREAPKQGCALGLGGSGSWPVRRELAQRGQRPGDPGH